MRTTSPNPVRLVAAVAATALCAAGLGAGLAAPTQASPPGEAKQVDKDVRFATFNASLNRNVEGQLVADLSTPNNAQASLIAETIQRVNPDVLLINEFDYVAGGQAAELFRDNYLAVPHNGAPAVDYPYYFVAPSNTGVPSGFDLNNNGVVGGPDDAFGFGFFPGQFGMAVFSKYPIQDDDIRTFQNFLWKDMPGALLPDDPTTAASAGLVLARRARRLPAVQQVALGRPDQHRQEDRALPRLAPDPARLRRSRGPQRDAQPRRDPVLGGLRDRRRGGVVHLRRRRAAPAASRTARGS